MTKQSKTLIIVLSGILLSGVCCCCGSAVYLMDAAPGWEAADASAEVEGVELGREGTPAQCLDAALARTAGCGVMDVECNGVLSAFTRACLAALPEPPTELCATVPPPTTFGAESLDASDAFCSARGQPMSAGCDTVFVALSEHCQALRARR